MKTIEYPITTNYISHWGLWEAAREVLQNAMDADDWSQRYTNHTMVVTNEGNLDPSAFLLGTTTKGANDRGQYGEGLKLALLVLARLCRQPVVTVPGTTYRASIAYSSAFNAEVLVLEIDDDLNESDCVEVSFHCTEEEYDDIDTKICGEEYGIVGNEGNIYVGSLFVCNMDLKYSYNLKPNDLMLGRDRNIPNLFDIQYCVGKYLSGEQVIDVALEERSDLSGHNTPEKEVAEAWVERYPDVVPVGMDEQHIIKADKTKVVPSWLARAIRSVVNFVYSKPKTPLEKLKEWRDSVDLDDEELEKLDTIIGELE